MSAVGAAANDFQAGSYNAAGARTVDDQCGVTTVLTLLGQDLTEFVDDLRSSATHATHEMAAIFDSLASDLPSSQLPALLPPSCLEPTFVRQTSFLRQISDTMASHVPSSQLPALLPQSCLEPSFVRQTSFLRQMSIERPPWLDQAIIFARQISCEQDSSSHLPRPDHTEETATALATSAATHLESPPANGLRMWLRLTLLLRFMRQFLLKISAR